MRAKTAEAIILVVVLVFTIAFAYGISVVAEYERQANRPIDRIERLEQKIDAIHRVVVGTNP